MKRFMAMVMLVSLLLSGCGLFRGNYVSVTPHQNTGLDKESTSIAARDYLELCDALKSMIREGQENFIIDVSNFESGIMDWEISHAVNYVRQYDPICAYAVEDIGFTLGTSGVSPAVAVEVSYRNGGSELRQLQSVRDMDTVQAQIGSALERCDTTLTLLVNDYASIDFQQFTQDYAEDHPDTVMEVPTVVWETYPSVGIVRVLALRFTYQNSRDNLREMKQQVSQVFTSAALYVNDDDVEERKYAQLYAFLKERFGEYQLKTSITPAYSLLRHGVGDSRAFATVYARMCGKAGLDCHVVTGTRDGEAWCWNMVCIEGDYYHLDLLNREASGRFRIMTDSQMDSYVWDYSAYPECTGKEPEQTDQDSTIQTDPTVPETTAPVETTAPTETTVPEETTVPVVPETTEPLPPETTLPQPPETSTPTQPEETAPPTTEKIN